MSHNPPQVRRIEVEPTVDPINTGYQKIITPEGAEFDLRIPDAMYRHVQPWYFELPWHKTRERELPKQAIDSLYYMARVEGYVCGGYLPIVLASRAVRESTARLDFAAGAWAPDENGHSLALYTFLDIYHGLTRSTRPDDLDFRRRGMPMRERVMEGVSKVAAVAVKETFLAAYSVIGYRNELMTQRGYASLRSRVNQAGEHPVLSPLLRHLMVEESDHAKMYKAAATEALEGRPMVQMAIRKFLKTWPGIVGEGFGGSEEADKIILYLFEDANGRDLVTQVDNLVSELPGLEGTTSTYDRLQQALDNQAIRNS